MLTKEQIQTLDRRIGHNADKIIKRVTSKLAPKPNPVGLGRPAVSICNCIQPEMLEVLHEGDDQWPLWVDDVVQGVARLDWYSRERRDPPLSAKNIVRCFAYLDTIDSYQISHLLGLGLRQAQVYLKACQLIHERLVDGFCDPAVRSIHYPDVFIYPRDPNRSSDLGD
jgi:hypothetical protein